MSVYVVTGASGQLGQDLVKELKSREHIVYGFDSKTMDITNSYDVSEIIKSINPDVIIHTAAYTNVDKAEEEQEQCYKVNVEGTKNMVEAAREVGSKFVYISTDYVFDGTKETPYETDDIPHPINTYGLSKRMGEIETLTYEPSFIVRISWVFGQNGNNFVKKMLELAQTRKELRVISDQVGSPTYTVDVSKFISDVAETEKYGIYHATNKGYISWYEFAKAIFATNKVDVLIHPIPSIEYPTKAERPHNSRLSSRSLTDNNFYELPTWEDALNRYNQETIRRRVR